MQAPPGTTLRAIIEVLLHADIRQSERRFVMARPRDRGCGRGGARGGCGNARGGCGGARCGQYMAVCAWSPLAPQVGQV